MMSPQSQLEGCSKHLQSQTKAYFNEISTEFDDVIRIVTICLQTAMISSHYGKRIISTVVVVNSQTLVVRRLTDKAMVVRVCGAAFLLSLLVQT